MWEEVGEGQLADPSVPWGWHCDLVKRVPRGTFD